MVRDVADAGLPGFLGQTLSVRPHIRFRRIGGSGGEAGERPLRRLAVERIDSWRRVGGRRIGCRLHPVICRWA